MKDRLQQFLDLKNMSAARLADMMGIQRSALSHILGGRNKPSYDFISKFITLFPYVNAEWFLTGKGEAFKNMSSPKTAAIPPTENLSQVHKEVQENDDDFPIAVKEVKDVTGPKEEKEEKEVREEMEEKGEKAFEPESTHDKRISKIVILFSDGTYQEMK